MNYADTLQSQPSFFDYPKDTRTIDEAFRRFHRENPHVYRAIVALARQAKARGWQQWSIKGIYEVIRWQHSVDTNSAPKLPNNFTSRYARLVMEQEPDLDGFFNTSKLTAP